MNALVFWGSMSFNPHTRLSFSNDHPTTLKDLLEFVHLQVLVGIAGLGARGDQSLLHGELDHKRLRIINAQSQDDGRGPQYLDVGEQVIIYEICNT